MALPAAARRLDSGARVHRFNRTGCTDLCANPSHRNHPIWIPYSGADEKNEWRLAADALVAGANPQLDF